MESIQSIRAALKQADSVQFQALREQYMHDARKGVQDALKTCARRLEKEAAERLRSEAMYTTMYEYCPGVSVGCDEVGRGPVAGPLAVAAVALPQEPKIFGLNDSKKLSPERREYLSECIKDIALAWHVSYIEPHEIDARGMAESLRIAFMDAIMSVRQDLKAAGMSGGDAILLDGNPLHLFDDEIALVKGDGRVANIAAASIVAKVDRDALMKEYDKTYPQYGFADNKGYASASHIEAIKIYGLTPIHRASFCTAWT